MSDNKFESFRGDIVASIDECCVKQNKDGSKSYNWQFAAVCSDVAKITNSPSAQLDNELLKIVRFEFNKFKNEVMTQDGWEDKSTKFGWRMSQGEVEYERTSKAWASNVSLESKIEGAVTLLDKAGKSLSAAKSQEATIRCKKRIRMIEKELDFLRKEKVNQDALRKEIASEMPLNDALAIIKEAQIESGQVPA